MYAGTPAAEPPEWICRDQSGIPMESYRSISPGLAVVRDYLVNVGKLEADQKFLGITLLYKIL